ncbi:MAG: sigma-70 family RNA polymerase sigma factor [Clostridia bacterium]
MIKNEYAFNKIYKEQYIGIFRYFLYRTSSKNDSEELMQNVFVILIENWDELQDVPTTNYRTWLYAVSRNTLTNYYKKKKRQPPLFSYDDVENMPEFASKIDFDKEISAFTDDFDEEEFTAAIINLLTDSEQELYKLIFIQNTKYKEIAKILGKSESAIKTKACRLHTKIKYLTSIVIEKKRLSI